MNPIVVVILNGVVHGAYECKDSQHAEKIFEHFAKTYVKGLTDEELNERLDDGYIEFDNGSVCLTWTLDPEKDDLSS
jgi:hypothetical protein